MVFTIYENIRLRLARKYDLASFIYDHIDGNGTYSNKNLFL